MARLDRILVGGVVIARGLHFAALEQRPLRGVSSASQLLARVSEGAVGAAFQVNAVAEIYRALATRICSPVAPTGTHLT